jgi:predicted short-subunit dehydrogenase-like oxidoreductase (DUF2520 family)
MDLTFSLVGVGRVGASLGRWLLAGGARLQAVARRGAQEPDWVATAGARRVPLAELSGAGEELLLLAVPDLVLPDVVAELARRPQARVALHTAGALTADALAPLRARGSAVGSLHPLHAFSRPLSSPEALRDAFWAIDGDATAVTLARRLVRAWGGCDGIVEPMVRPLYHLAASLAAGGAVTLVGAALELAERLGVPSCARAGYLRLAAGALAGVDPATTAAAEPRIEGDPGSPTAAAARRALTGPLVRGDRSLLGALEALRRERPELHPLAVSLALETLRQLDQRRPLSPAQQELRRALRGVAAAPGFLDPLFR